MPDIAAIESLLEYLTHEEKAELDRLLVAGGDAIWQPLPGPQTQAFESEATIIGYGGAAGGGKTDLACGKSLTQHQRVMILRREATQLTGIIDRLTELLGGRDGYNGQEKIWRLPDRGVQIEFGSLPNPGDETKYQGRPHDLLVFDETANFLEAQVRFLLGWLRTTDPEQKCQALMTFNPPTTAEGRWLISFFAPWLDDKHPNPAEPGEIRWFAAVDGKEIEVDSGDPFYHNDELITPQSRTFIPSRIADNPYLMGTGYMTQLQALPEPLRSQMLHGDFKAGLEDDPWQVIPSAWVDEAMNRWEKRDKKGKMDGMGVDVARGGKDRTVIARRHGTWFDEPIVYEGVQTPEGDVTAGYVISARRDRCPVHIDVIGWGSEAYAYLKTNQVQTIPVNGALSVEATTAKGDLRFANLRAKLYWRMREALDPTSDNAIALPPDPGLRADLCAPTWDLRSGKVYLEPKEALAERIGRSPDKGDAYVMALIETPRTEDHPGNGAQAQKRREYNPYKSGR